MTSTAPTQAPSLVKVLTALAEMGEATAAGVARSAGLAYSTTTPKLRELEAAGHAEPFRAPDGRTLWRPTAAGRAAAAGSPVEQITAADAVPGADAVTQAEASHVSAAHVDNPVDGEDPAGEPSVDGGPVKAQPDADDEPFTAPREADAAGSAADQSDEAAGQTAEVATDPAETSGDGQARRPKGALRAAVLDILENSPERQFKVGELCKLVNRVEASTGMPKASQGAVANILHKLAAAGIAVQTVEKPATFQLAASEA